MTVKEALAQTQKKKAGLINKASVNYAETLLLPGEKPEAAAIANIYTRRDKFPGIVVITDQRVIAACGIPGIKRDICMNIRDLENCRRDQHDHAVQSNFPYQKGSLRHERRS